jgi:hypothetical protein
VTGTPISRGLEDIHGLLAFLRAQPWAEPAVWARLLQAPLEAGRPEGRARLLALLQPASGGLMWRTAKLDVLAELALPAQHHHVTGGVGWGLEVREHRAGALLASHVMLCMQPRPRRRCRLPQVLAQQRSSPGCALVPPMHCPGSTGCLVRWCSRRQL